MCDYDHVAIYWLPSNGAIIQCGRKAHAIKAGRTSRVQQVVSAVIHKRPLILLIECRLGQGG